EQARGQLVDKQTDIWAFGCVLYEMLTGTNAFAGATTTDTLAAIVEHEPNWARLPAATPPTVLSMLRRCLQKDPMRRLRDIADARFQIEEALSEPLSAVDVGTPVPSRRTPERLLWVTALVAAVVATVAVTTRYLDQRQVPAREVRLEINTPPTTEPTSLAASPDGRQLAFVATSEGTSRLWVRALDDASARPLAGTENAKLPFWS